MPLNKAFPNSFGLTLPRALALQARTASGKTTSFENSHKRVQSTRSRSKSSSACAKLLLSSESSSSLPSAQDRAVESHLGRSTGSVPNDYSVTLLTGQQVPSSSHAQGEHQISDVDVSVLTMGGDRVDLKIDGVTSLEHVTVISVKQKLARMWDARVCELKLLHPDHATVCSDSDRPFAMLASGGKHAHVLRASYATGFASVRLNRGFARGMKLEATITLSEDQQYTIRGGYRDPLGIMSSVPYQVSGLFQVACASSRWHERPAIDLLLAGGGHFFDLQIFEDGTLRVKPDSSVWSSFSGPSLFKVLNSDSFRDSELSLNYENDDAACPMVVKFASSRVEEASLRNSMPA